MLIEEEAKAVLLSEWEQFKAEHDINGESTRESRTLSLILHWMALSKEILSINRFYFTFQSYEDLSMLLASSHCCLECATCMLEALFSSLDVKKMDVFLYV